MRLPAVVPAIALLTACGSGGGGPTFADDHPRTYLSRNLDRLRVSLDEGHPAAVRFKEIVDAQLGGGEIYDFQAWYAALIGKLTGEAQYCDYAVDQVETFVSSEYDLINSGENPQVAFDSYLEVGARLGDVLLTYDWCFDAAGDSEKGRWLDFAAQTVKNIWDPEGAEWGGRSAPWSGWSIDNPSNNYYYSFLRATMLFGLVAHGEHADADQWLDFFRDTKIGGQLVPTFEEQLAGGGSREGTGYGVAMMRLWELYDLWQGSTGEDLSRLTGHTRASMLWMTHAIVPTRDRLAPIGDHSRDSTASLFDYHRHYLQTIAYLFPDDPQVPHVNYLLENSTVPEMDTPFMYVYDFLYESDVAAAPMGEMGRAYFGPGTGQLFARSSWETDATWINFIAGPYTESHAHHDQGSILIYKDGWLAEDPIVEGESTGIRQEEELHNLVRIVGAGGTVPQREGTESRMLAVASGDGWVHAAGDLTPAYDAAPEITNVEREVVFLEPDTVVVFDRVDTAGGTSQIWQLSSPSQPALAGATATMGNLEVVRLAPAVADVSVFDWTSDSLPGGYRLDEELAGGANTYLHVLSVDGAVTSAVRDDAEGRIGATIELSDGRSATVRFSADGVDGTLEIRDGGGGVVIDESLGEGVEALPE